MSDTFDLVIIGAGPAGYLAAASASQKGMKTAIIENRQLGGTCLNRGCIPTKTLMHSSQLYRQFLSAGSVGIHAEALSFQMDEIQAHKESVITQLRSGIAALLKKNKVTVLEGTGTILDRHLVQAGDVRLETRHILICTGSVPAMPPIPGIDLPNVLNSDAMLDRASLYRRLIIIGGGVIGMEFASICRDLGAEVTVIEALDRLLGNMDKEFSQSLKMLMKKRGVSVHTGAAVQKIRSGENGSLVCVFREKEQILELEADGILVATGRRPNTEGLLGEGVSLAMERGRICVDDHFETNIPGIYAAGDVIGKIQLAHAASAQALCAVAYMNQEQPPKDLTVIPSCVYTSPEIASVGLSPEEAKASGMNVRTVKYPMSANGKSVLSGEERGFIKITVQLPSEKILGAQMMCARATDMIAIFAQAISGGLTVSQMSSVVYPHPTFSEGISEALSLFTPAAGK